MSKKIALVTGAEGFNGSHLVKHLVQQGWQVRAFVLYNSFQSLGWLDSLPTKILPNIEVFFGDVRDAFRVQEATEGVDVVFHLAALIAIPYSYHAVQSYVGVNINGTLNLLEALKKQKQTRLLCISTSEVYGTATYVPIDEAHPLQPQSPYSASKIGAESLALSYFHSFDLDVTVLRPFNTYGPHQSIRAVIPSIILQLLRNEPELQLGDPTPTRDFLFVNDHVAALEKVALQPASKGQVLNIATNQEISIGDLAELLIKKIRTLTKLVLDNKRLRPEGSEVKRLCGDAR